MPLTPIFTLKSVLSFLVPYPFQIIQQLFQSLNMLSITMQYHYEVLLLLPFDLIFNLYIKGIYINKYF